MKKPLFVTHVILLLCALSTTVYAQPPDTLTVTVDDLTYSDLGNTSIRRTDLGVYLLTIGLQATGTSNCHNDPYCLDAGLDSKSVKLVQDLQVSASAWDIDNDIDVDIYFRGRSRWKTAVYDDGEDLVLDANASLKGSVQGWGSCNAGICLIEMTILGGGKRGSAELDLDGVLSVNATGASWESLNGTVKMTIRPLHDRVLVR